MSDCYRRFSQGCLPLLLCVFFATDAFDGSEFVLLNMMWQALPEVTLGIEYNYGVRENADGSDLDNHRLMFGV